MIDDFYNEQEQWERVKRWLRENGPWLIAGVILGLGALGAWRWWEARVERRHVEASEAYQQILQTLERGDRAAALKAVDALRTEYASSAYADQSDLLAARVHVDAGEFGPAAERLSRVMEKSADPQLQLVARVRLARVQIAQNNADAALKTLDGAEPGGFAARFAEVRGDALYAKGDRVAALTAWRKAEAEAGGKDGKPATLDLEGLKLKIWDLESDGVKLPAANAAATPAAAPAATPAPAAAPTAPAKP
ncbi:MAG: tetratricopeptide repeat protein [Hyphomicrobiales bacterium]|nr:tetratricopeptide repeat protein [Hyphomicrobiales bacterium]